MRKHMSASKKGTAKVRFVAAAVDSFPNETRIV
jgi:hypothetical protein